MSATSDLPAAFSDLQKLIDWAEPTEAKRTARRLASTMQDLQALYDALLPRLAAALDYLNGFPLDAMPPAERRLLDLTLAYAEIAPYVEQYHRVSIPETFDERRFIIGHEQPRATAP